MTRSADECGLFRQFSLCRAVTASDDGFVELLLDAPLSLEVGNDGIIGRRVSLYSHSSPGPDMLVAEGVVGFNFHSQIQSLL